MIIDLFAAQLRQQKMVNLKILLIQEQAFMETALQDAKHVQTLVRPNAQLQRTDIIWTLLQLLRLHVQLDVRLVMILYHVQLAYQVWELAVIEQLEICLYVPRLSLMMVSSQLQVLLQVKRRVFRIQHLLMSQAMSKSPARNVVVR